MTLRDDMWEKHTIRSEQIQEWKEKAEKLDLIMEGLVVDNRPATPEEVREFINYALKVFVDTKTNTKGFALNSGAVLKKE